MDDDKEYEYWVEHHLPKGWWKHPVFDFGINQPAPYIWFGYWLITWGLDDFHWKNLEISFMPD